MGGSIAGAQSSPQTLIGKSVSSNLVSLGVLTHHAVTGETHVSRLRDQRDPMRRRARDFQAASQMRRVTSLAPGRYRQTRQRQGILARHQHPDSGSYTDLSGVISYKPVSSQLPAGQQCTPPLVIGLAEIRVPRENLAASAADGVRGERAVQTFSHALKCEPLPFGWQ
jgi:hypothetical protein